MSDIRQILRAATWKLTLARTLSCTLAVAAVAAAIWIVLVLLIGMSSVALVVLACAALVAIAVGAWLSRSNALDAARRVEQLAGWRERLSTAVELESAGSKNVFYRRLRAEVEQLLREHSPSRLIPWDLQRPATAAVVLVIAAIVVTALFPGGLRRSRTGSPVMRNQAALIVQGEAKRLENLSASSPGISELRARLVNVLDQIRGDRPVDEVQDSVASGIADAKAMTGGALEREAKDISGAMARAKGLTPLADAVGRLDSKGIANEAARASAAIPSMSEAERAETAGALNAAAGKSDSPGFADPLKQAGRAAAEGDPRQFRDAFARFAAAMDRRVDEEDAERKAADMARDALTRAQSVLAGRGDPGSRSTARSTEFFTPGKASADNATGTGNLIVRGKRDDFKQVWEVAHAADANVPKLNDVIDNGLGAGGRETFDPGYRDYVRKYFTPESDNAARRTTP